MLMGSGELGCYWDKQWDSWVANLRQGDYAVSDEPVLISTVLGSCISACIFSPEKQLGGINHFLLPEPGESDQLSASLRYGVNAMEVLINTLLQLGASRQGLIVKICGAADVLSGITNRVGQVNAEFIRDYIKTEKLNLVAEDLGGQLPRRIMYNPVTGSLKIKKLRKTLSETDVTKEQTLAERLVRSTSQEADVELF